MLADVCALSGHIPSSASKNLGESRGAGLTSFNFPSNVVATCTTHLPAGDTRFVCRTRPRASSFLCKVQPFCSRWISIVKMHHKKTYKNHFMKMKTSWMKEPGLKRFYFILYVHDIQMFSCTYLVFSTSGPASFSPSFCGRLPRSSALFRSLWSLGELSNRGGPHFRPRALATRWNNEETAEDEVHHTERFRSHRKAVHSNNTTY